MVEKMSEIFIKINPIIMGKMIKIRKFQKNKQTDQFDFWSIELNEVLDKSLDLMIKTMEKKTKERK